MAGVSLSTNWADYAEESESDDEVDVMSRINKTSKTQTEKPKPKVNKFMLQMGVAASDRPDDDTGDFTEVKSKDTKRKDKKMQNQRAIENQYDKREQTRKMNAQKEDERLSKMANKRPPFCPNKQETINGFTVLFNQPNPEPRKYSTSCHFIFLGEDDDELRKCILPMIEKNTFETKNGTVRPYNSIVYKTDQTELIAPKCVNVILFYENMPSVKDDGTRDHYGVLIMIFRPDARHQPQDLLYRGVNELTDMMCKVRSIERAKTELVDTSSE